MTIATRWQAICTEIANIQQQQLKQTSNHQNKVKNHLPARIVSTIAVSKKQPVDFIRQAYNAGARNFGESFIQEALPKIKQLAELEDIVWHFIGPIQSNKTQHIAANFDWVQSVSRAKIARRLSQQRSKNLPPLNVLLQINISQEDTKSGLSTNQIGELANLVESLPKLSLRGLMCIPVKTDNQQQQTLVFKTMTQLFEETQRLFPNIDTLSMGMSRDYLAAVQSGSNMVRIGTILFGSRKVISREP